MLFPSVRYAEIWCIESEDGQTESKIMYHTLDYFQYWRKQEIEKGYALLEPSKCGTLQFNYETFSTILSQSVKVAIIDCIIIYQANGLWPNYYWDYHWLRENYIRSTKLARGIFRELKGESAFVRITKEWLDNGGPHTSKERGSSVRIARSLKLCII